MIVAVGVAALVVVAAIVVVVVDLIVVILCGSTSARDVPVLVL